jgi:DNA replicative helicase MCM subunit Mcm2 (Cdc46/Mcm family)
MSEEIERARPKLGVSLRETSYPDGRIERRIDVITDDDLLELLVAIGIVIVFGVVITAILSK